MPRKASGMTLNKRQINRRRNRSVLFCAPSKYFLKEYLPIRYNADPAMRWGMSPGIAINLYDEYVLFFFYLLLLWSFVTELYGRGHGCCPVPSILSAVTMEWFFGEHELCDVVTHWERDTTHGESFPFSKKTYCLNRIINIIGRRWQVSIKRPWF